MIAQGSVSRYRRRELSSDSRVLREVDEKALDAMLARLKPVPEFHTAPRWYQKAMFLLAVKHPGYLFGPDPGLGKSKHGLDVFRWRVARGEAHHALVQVPAIENMDEWVREARRHAPDVVVRPLEGTPAQRAALMASPPVGGIVVAPYAGVLALVCELVGKGDGRSRYRLSARKCRALMKVFDFLIWDESTFLANHDALYCRAAWQMGKFTPYRMGFAGKVYGKSPEQVFGQFKACDRGATFGVNVGLFREAYFRASKRRFGPGYDWTFRTARRREFARAMANRCFRLTTEQAGIKLPIFGGLISKDGPIVKSARFSPEQWTHYEALLKRIRDQDEDERENTWLQMRQLTSGYLSVENDQGDKIIVEFGTNPKLDRLIAFIKDEMPHGKKMLVFHWLKQTGRVISKALKKARIPHGRIAGDVPRGERRKAKAGFVDGGLPVLVANEAAAYGLNLQRGNYCGFVESTTDPIKRVQMERRIARSGLEGAGFILDFVIERSLDVSILNSLVAGEDLFRQVVDGEKTIELKRGRFWS